MKRNNETNDIKFHDSNWNILEWTHLEKSSTLVYLRVMDFFFTFISVDDYEIPLCQACVKNII